MRMEYAFNLPLHRWQNPVRTPFTHTHTHAHTHDHARRIGIIKRDTHPSHGMLINVQVACRRDARTITRTHLVIVVAVNISDLKNKFIVILLVLLFVVVVVVVALFVVVLLMRPRSFTHQQSRLNQRATTPNARQVPTTQS
jgi:hypothetical protein